MSDVVEAIQEAVMRLKERRDRGEHISAPSDSGIDWFLDAPDSSSKLLDETDIYEVPMKWEPVQGSQMVGVDGSSRRFSTPYGSLVIATVALTSGPLPLIDYPPISYEYPVRVELTSPFMATYKTLGVEHDLIATESPGGHLYEPLISPSSSEGGVKGYAIADIAHEVRISLETLGLKIAVEVVPDKSLILLDGPLYQRTWSREIRRNPYLRDDWRELTKERIEVLKKASEDGFIVLGSVKRLDKSQHLVKIHGSLLGKFGLPFQPQENDHAETIFLASLHVRKRKLSGYGPLLIGPFSLNPSQDVKNEVGIDIPEIIYSYVVIPQMPFTGDLNTPCGVLRLEVLRSDYEKEGIKVFFRALSEGIRQALPLPIAQFYADYRCKRTSKAFFDHICRTALMEGVELSYETWLTFNQVGEEYAE
jgi:hypothetical protein